MLNTNIKKLLKLEGGMNFSFGSDIKKEESRKDFRSSTNDGHSDWVDSVSEKTEGVKFKGESISLEEVSKRIEGLNQEILDQSSLVAKLKEIKGSQLGFEEFKLNSMRDGRDALMTTKNKLQK